MTKAAAMQSFWESFGLPAYEESNVPPGAVFPYITYQFVSDSFDSPVLTTASLWYKTTRWVEPNAKAEEISKYLSYNGKLIFCDDGAVWFHKGSPFSTSMGDPENKNIKRKVLNVIVEYMTEY